MAAALTMAGVAAATTIDLSRTFVQEPSKPGRLFLLQEAPEAFPSLIPN